MTRFYVTEPFVVSLLSPLVDAGTLGEVKPVTARGLLAEASNFPSVFVCSLTPREKSATAGFGHSEMEYEQETFITVRVKTAGQNIGEGKERAWALLQIISDTIQNQVPIDGSGGDVYGPLLPGDPFEPDVTSADEYGVGIIFKCEVFYCK